MGLSIEERNALATYRMQRAKETLDEAKAMIESSFWRIAANRLYYACYYAATALLIKHEHDTHTHSGAFSMLGLHFVSTGLISMEHNKLYRRLMELRQMGDYSDWITVNQEDVTPLFKPAEKFIETIENIIYSL